jgi:sugar-specific transcriptional regulator TrmB
MAEDERAQVLVDLGLTFLQAKVYLALSQTGEAKIETISKTSNTARQDIYRIMPTLQKLGLAEKMLAKPTMYKATPIKEGYYLLLQNKTREHIDLQKKTIALIKKSHEDNAEQRFQEEETRFVVTSSETLLFRRFAEREKTVLTSINAVSGWESLKSTLFNRFHDFEGALERGVKIRIITENYEDDRSMQKIIQTLTSKPLFRIRYLSTPLPVKTVIHDETEANMCIAISADCDVPSLWSNNPQFVKVMTTYFEGLWNKARNIL